MESEKVWLYRWRAAKIPFFIGGGFYLLSLITAFVSFSLYQSIFMNSLLLYVVLIGAFVVGAHIALVDYHLPRKRVIQGGMLAGAGIGLISALVSIILLKNTALMDVSVNIAMAKVAASGAAVDASMLETTIMVGAYVGIVISPLINGALGALFTWISALVTKKFVSVDQSEASATPIMTKSVKKSSKKK